MWKCTHGMMPAGPGPLCTVFRSSLSSCARWVGDERGHLGGCWVDTSLGSNDREAVEGDGDGGWWMCDDCEERSSDWRVLIHMWLITAPPLISGFGILLRPLMTRSLKFKMLCFISLSYTVQNDTQHSTEERSYTVYPVDERLNKLMGCFKLLLHVY